MFRKATLFLAVFWCSPVFLFPQDIPRLRSLNDLFPALTGEIKDQVFSPEGYFTASDKNYRLLESLEFDPQFRTTISRLTPSVVVEFLCVLPYQADPLALVDIYNGLRRVRSLKGRLYHSTTRGADIPLFEDATRIVGPRKTTVVDDPAPRTNLPDSETIYIRLKDANFGNTYYQADIRRASSGFVYTLSNNRDISLFLFPAMKAGRFIAEFYFEPIDSGTLIYCLSGATVSDFVSSRMNMPSAIQKRIAVILGWVIDGLSGRL